jgi:GNAT superfamily N-acetyltransferase
MKIQLREPETAADFALYYDLRWRVLREPWTQDRESSKDEYEQNAIHLMAWFDDKLVGVGRVHLNSREEAQIRYMAVEEGYTGKHVGTVILKALEDRARQIGAKLTILNARESALGFYRKRHYRLTGRADTLFESIPHWRMCKNLDALD